MNPIQMLVMLALAQGQGVVLDGKENVKIFDPGDFKVNFKDKSWVQVDPAAVMDQIRRDPRTRGLT